MKIKWFLKKLGTKIYDNRANIEFIAGAALVCVGTGMAISKAEKAVEVKNSMQDEKTVIELKDSANSWTSDGERTKACLSMAKNATVGYVKTYAVPIGVEAAGLVLMGISHATLNKQVQTVSAALASTTLAFSQYRERVRQDLGEEKDEEYFLAEPKTEIVTDENGNTFEVTDLPAAPPHTFIFDESNHNYKKFPGANRDFLETRLKFLNEKLWVDGILWENDIRRDLDVPIDPEAVNFGITAVDDEGNRQYISLGMEKNTERAQAFRDGTEQSFWCELNMEPDISHKLYRLDKYHK